MKQILSFLALAIVAGNSSAAMGPQFRIRDLGPAYIQNQALLYGGSVDHINDRGVSVGVAPFAGEPYAAVWYPGQGAQSLGSPGTDSAAMGVSAAGVIAGCYGDFYSYGYTTACLWYPSSDTAVPQTPVPLASPGYPYALASGVNCSGTVCGQVRNDSGDLEAVIWQAGQMFKLGILPGKSVSCCDSNSLINEFGQVVGFSAEDLWAGRSQAFLWTPYSPNGTSGQLMPMPRDNSIAYAINNYGSVCGTFIDPDDKRFHEFVWRPAYGNAATEGTFFDLGTPAGKDCIPFGINDLDETVGEVETGGTNYTNRAFLYIFGKGRFDLNRCLVNGAGWVLYVANSINDRGQIVGMGNLNGAWRSFELTPIDDYDGQY